MTSTCRLLLQITQFKYLVAIIAVIAVTVREFGLDIVRILLKRRGCAPCQARESPVSSFVTKRHENRKKHNSRGDLAPLSRTHLKRPIMAMEECHAKTKKILGRVQT